MSKYIKEEDACVRLWKKLRGLSDVIPMGKDAAGVAVRIIEDMPIADVEPVRHGHWDEDMECSICGCLAPVSHVTGEEYAYDYCPNCGAKMDEEEQENV